MPPEKQRVTIRKYREVTINGRTIVSELYAEGSLDAAGRLCLTCCAGRIQNRASLHAGKTNTQNAA